MQGGSQGRSSPEEAAAGHAARTCPPQFPLYGCGSKLVKNHPVSAIQDGIGLNMTVQSYDGHLDFGLVACRELVPDLWDLMDYLGDALRELREAAKASDA